MPLLTKFNRTMNYFAGGVIYTKHKNILLKWNINTEKKITRESADVNDCDLKLMPTFNFRNKDHIQ